MPISMWRVRDLRSAEC